MKRRNFTLIELFVLIFICLNVGLWIGNVVHLVNCDWEDDKSWKGEIIHTLGVVSPIYLVTGWTSFEEE
jgi:hypothetical protein